MIDPWHHVRSYPENDERPVDVFLARNLELDRRKQEFSERFLEPPPELQ